MTACICSLLACTVGPDYEKPPIALPDEWISKETKTLSAKTDIDQKWWRNFNDPVLSELIDKAAANNLDLKIAEARIAQARAGVSSAQADLLPKGDIQASALREANQMAMPGGIQADLLRKPFNIFQAGFDASWEIDLFGGNRRAEESAEAQMQATEASRDDLRISLMAEVARTYVSLRNSQAQLLVAQNVVETSWNTVDIANRRFESGQAPRMEVVQAESRLEQARAQIPTLRNYVAQAEYGLDVLLGQQPGVVHKLVSDHRPVPLSDKKLILAAPASVIASRPDIRMAERKLAAATAQQGVALAQFFPKISLSGFFGVLNSSTSQLFTSQNKSWLAAGGIVWPILSYNSLSANFDVANAMQQEAIASYQRTILNALSDVERSLSAYTQQEKFHEATALDFEKNKKAREIAEERYREGVTSRLEALEADRVFYAAQNRLIQARAESSQNLIALYKSLGGGWER